MRVVSEEGKERREGVVRIEQVEGTWRQKKREEEAEKEGRVHGGWRRVVALVEEGGREGHLHY